ncbi:MAG: hypothetical protein IJU60_05650 [Acholeplasmatales bacterium]|nr:hypothetical protein [Acholeplasmatales bacterium]
MKEEPLFFVTTNLSYNKNINFTNFHNYLYIYTNAKAPYSSSIDKFGVFNEIINKLIKFFTTILTGGFRGFSLDYFSENFI